MKKQQKGFALAISLILMIILTFLGFNIASRGKLTSQVIRTSSQYDAISAAAEAEMYRLMAAISKTEERIEKGNKMVLAYKGSELGEDEHFAGFPADEVIEVWDSRLLAEEFGSTGLPVFSNYRSKAWNLGILGSVNAQKALDEKQNGAIRTRSFVQELVNQSKSSDYGNQEIDFYYLVTTKAYYVRKPQPQSNAENDVEQETIVLQSLTKKSFIE